MPATTLVPARQGGQAGATVDTPNPQAVMANPFTRAAREHVEPFDDRSTLMQAAAGVAVGPIDVAAYGFFRHVVMLVNATGGVGGAATVAAHEDSPWRALRDIQLTDVNGVPIVGPYNGYDLYLANKYGAYAFDTDPANSPAFSALVTGAGASGNFSFLIRVPVEVAGRDGFGSLPNMNAAATYKLSYTVAPSSEVYTVAPATTLPTVRVRCFLEAWSEPYQADARGVPNATQPPAAGSTQFWTKAPINVNGGDQRLRLTRMGNLLRTLIFIFRTGGGPTRDTTNFPDPLRIEWDGKILVNMPRDLVRHYMRERYGFAPDAGVFVFDFQHDMDYKPGNEMRDLWLPTTLASRIELVGTFGAAGTLSVLTNDVAPTDNVYDTDL